LRAFGGRPRPPAAGRTTPKPKTAPSRWRAARDKGTRLIERTERVLAEGLPRKGTN